MKEVNIYYYPVIAEEEKLIINESFEGCRVNFTKYEIKGIVGGVIDTQIIFDFLNNQYVRGLLTGVGIVKVIIPVVKKIFRRNRKKIEDNKSRPRYTTLVLRMEKKNIVITNANKENEVRISKITADFKYLKEKKYSDETLKDYVKNEKNLPPV